MKKEKTIALISVLTVAIFVCLFLCLKKDNNSGNKPINNVKDKFVYLGSYKDELIGEKNYVIKTYEEYINLFNDDKLTEEDFNDYNYILVPITYDVCADTDIEPVSYKVSDNKYTVKFQYKAECGVCPSEYMYYALKVDKNVTDIDLDIKYEAINKPECNRLVSYKPIIYLYPEKTMNITVRLGKPELLTTTYPLYKNSWNVTADPNGLLKDKNGRSYYGLYWEGVNNLKDVFKDGFVVEKENLISFLEDKLSLLGLTDREANEFIVYWLPELEKNEYNLMRFESLEVVNEQMPLYVNPNPDTIIRVFMEYTPIDKPINIKKQELNPATRKGYTLVEWGGTKINSFEK